MRELTQDVARRDYQCLVRAEPELRMGRLVGCKAVDWGTYKERLKARRRGKRSPAEVLADPEQRAYLEQKAAHLGQDLHSILGLYAGLCSSFRPLHAKYLCHRFKATHVVDFAAGWGSRMLGAHAAGCRYTGVDTNVGLKEGYEKLIRLTGGKTTMIWDGAETVDFTELPEFDLVMTSPPFGDLEVYPGMPRYNDFTRDWFIPTSICAFAALKPGGWMALCIPEDMARALIEELGEPDEVIQLPIRARQSGGGEVRTEAVYCWQMPGESGPDVVVEHTSLRRGSDAVGHVVYEGVIGKR